MIRINLAPEAKRRRGFGFPGLPAFKLPSFNLGVLFGLIYVIAIVGVTAYWLLLANEGRPGKPKPRRRFASGARLIRIIRPCLPAA